MNRSRILTVCLGTTFLMFSPEWGRGWRGLTPLRSTRTDVERLLGPAERSGSVSIYRTGNGLVEVDYATGPCRGKTLGWNVPADTVLEIHVAPQGTEKLSIDEVKYSRAQGHVERPTYINLRDGIRYEVLPDGTVYSISYIPSEEDRGLRCRGFPPYDGGLTQYRPFDSYGDIPLVQQEARLDNYASSLQSDLGAKGYIIVYAGRQARLNEAASHGQKAREYIVSKRGIEGRRLIVLDGGYREGLETELYIVPSDLPAPAPKPTIPANEVRIIGATMRNNRRHKPI